MKLENQCCTLDQAKRLNELGVKQGLSIFFYDEFREGVVYNNHPKEPSYFNAESCFSAFTVAELGLMLPTLGIEYVKSNNGHGKDFWWLSGHYWKTKGHRFENEHEAQARAEMLIYLIKSDVITLDEVNKRLAQS